MNAVDSVARHNLSLKGSYYFSTLRFRLNAFIDYLRGLVRFGSPARISETKLIDKSIAKKN
jgi:hypothetical protein